MRKFLNESVWGLLPFVFVFVFPVFGEKTPEEKTEELLKDLSLVTVLVTTPERKGTAVVIDTSTLVTNAHNIKDRHGNINIDQIRLTRPQRDGSKGVPLFLVAFAGEAYKVKGIKYISYVHDLAVLQADDSYWPTARPGPLTPPATGEVVWTAGYPRGKFSIFKGSVVGEVDTDLIVALDGEGMHGLSGAALFNEAGKVMGVIYRTAGNIAHATPVKYLNLDKLPPEDPRFKKKWGGGTTYVPDTVYRKIRRVAVTHWQIFNAHRILHREVAKGNALAQLRKGEILMEQGQDSEALKMFEASVSGGNVSASIALSHLYVQRGEKEKATALLEDMLAQQKTHPAIFYNLGILYLEEGKTNPENFGKAYDMFSQAVRMYHSGAMYNMGFMLLKGEGVQKDEIRAKKLFGLAATLNFEPASQVLLSLENQESSEKGDLSCKGSVFKKL